MDKETGYTIGFGGKFWTLWNITKETKPYGEEIHNTYIQNLSLDLEKAKEKFLKITGGSKLIINENLKGTSFIERERKEWIDYKNDEFKFGKYRGDKLIDVAKTDIEYLKWYYFGSNGNSDIEFVKAFEASDEIIFISYTFKEFDSEYNHSSIDIMFFDTEKEKELFIKNYTLRFLDMEEDFFYEDKEKIEKDVILIRKNSVTTRFGEMNTYIFFCKNDNTTFRYSGSKEYDIDLYDSIRVKGTVKHNSNDWEQHNETKILRMTII